MDVAFGDISINVTSAVNQSLVPTNTWVLRGLTSPLVTYGTRYNLDDNEPAACPVSYYIFNTDGSFEDSTGTTPSSAIDSMGSGILIGPNYAVINQGNFYSVFDFPQAGEMVLSGLDSTGVPFNKSAIDAVPALDKITVCHFTLAQS